MVEEQNIKLVLTVEKYPRLYNYTLSQYSRKDVTDKAWNEVAKEMQMTAGACKDKWRNLRSVFIRHMKIPPSCSGSGKKKKPYYLLEAMQFLIPFTKALVPPESGNSPAANNTLQQEQIIETSYEQVTENSDNTTDPNISQIAQNPSNSGVQDNYSKRKRPISEIDKIVLTYFKKKTSALEDTRTSQNNSSPRSEATKMFLLSFLPELDELTDSQLKIFKRRVMYLIDDISGQNQTQFTNSPASTSVLTPEPLMPDTQHTYQHPATPSPINYCIQQEQNPGGTLIIQGVDFMNMMNDNDK